MRLVLAAFAALYASAPAAFAAGPTPLEPISVTHGTISRLHAAAGDAVAWEDVHGRVIVRFDDGRQRRVPIPAGCEKDASLRYGLVAAGGGRLLFSCRDLPPAMAFSFRVTRLDGTVAARRDLPMAEGAGAPSPTTVAVGARWIAQRFVGYHEQIRWYVDWRTGAVRKDSGWEEPPSDEATTFEDLDAVEPRQPLCPPLPRVELLPYAPSPLVAAPPFAAELGQDSRVLILRRCGQARPVLTVRGRAVVRAALSSGWLAYAGSSGRRVVLVRLHDGRRFAVRVAGAVERLILTRGRLHVGSTANATTPVPRSLQSVRLPSARRDARSDGRR